VKKISANSVFILLLLLMILVGNYYFKPASEKPVVFISDCDLGKEKCKVNLAESELEIAIHGEIKALQIFTISIIDDDNLIEHANVDLKMKAMDMGKNRFAFVKSGVHSWKSDVVIPVCTTGRRDWLFEFEFIKSGVRERVIFEITI